MWNCKEDQVVSHIIRLQVADSNGFLVDGTQFDCTLNLVKKGNVIIVGIPTLNFQVGQVSLENPLGAVTVPGGYVYSIGGYIPPEFRPADSVPPTVVAGSNNGLQSVFDVTLTPFPTPVLGYLVQITNGGELIIQGQGTFGNIIPAGPQTVLPTSITYIYKPRSQICQNFRLSRGFFDVPAISAGYNVIGYRDTHYCDTFDGLAAWAWCDNSQVVDKTYGTTNCYVRLGKIHNGRLKLRPTVAITNFTSSQIALIFNTSVAINRKDKKNIVVSYAVLSTDPTLAGAYRAVSFDGGKTFPTNGIWNITITQPEPSDPNGVKADAYGNFWYQAGVFTRTPTYVHQPLWAISTDGGLNFQTVYQPPESFLAPNYFEYDYPQWTFGGSIADETYGIYFCVDLVELNGNTDKALGFIPIRGPTFADVGPGQIYNVGNRNANILSEIAVSKDVRLWTSGFPGSGGDFTNIVPNALNYKSPGPLDQNFAGSWTIGMMNMTGDQYGGEFGNVSGQISNPLYGYFNNPIIYDNELQALYALNQTQDPFFSQSMRLQLKISRNNGQTWSQPIDINTSNHGNRGQCSMALDLKKGNLIIGWYDGRNDPTFKRTQYFSAVLSRNQLKKLVQAIPISDPVYLIPNPVNPPTSI